MVDRARVQASASFQPAQIADRTVSSTAYSQLFNSINSAVSGRLDKIVAAEGKQAGADAGAGKTSGVELKDVATIRGRNFNDGALQAMGAQLKTNIAEEADRILFEHPNDIQSAGVALQSAREAFTKEIQPELRPAMIEQFNRVEAKVKQTVQVNAFNKARAEQLDQFTAGLNTATEQAKEAAFTNDGAGMLQATEEYMVTLQAMVNQEQITEGDAKLRLANFERDLDTDILFGEFMRSRANGNGEEHFDRFNKKPPKNIDKKQFEGLRGSMLSQLRADKVDDTIKKGEVSAKVTDALFVMKRGVTPGDFDQLMVEASAFPDLQEKLLFGRRNADVMGAVSKMNPSAQLQIINDIRTDQPDTREDIQLLESLEQINRDTITGIQNDPVSLLAKLGEDVPPLDLESEESLLGRKRLGEKVTASYGVESHGFTKPEVDAIGNAIDLADPETKVGLMQRLQETQGDQQTSVLMAELAPKYPEFVVAAGIANEAPQSSKDILIGQEILKENSGVTPTIGDVQLIVDDTFGDILPPEVRGQVTKAAIAMDAAQRFRNGTLSKEEFDEDDFQDRLQDITGNVIEYNDKRILAPVRGMDEDSFEDFLEGLDDMALARQGFVPRAGSTPITMKMVRKDATFTQVGDGKYLIMLGNGFVTDPNGQPFEWNLREIAGNGS